MGRMMMWALDTCAEPRKKEVHVLARFVTRGDLEEKSSGKVPRKIHKAAREKLKRDHLNDLFSDLGNTLDLDHLNNGKASMLRETIRLIGELLTQVENLKKENVTTERNELLDETSALDTQIKNLQRQIDERTNCSNLDISEPLDQFNNRINRRSHHLPSSRPCTRVDPCRGSRICHAVTS
ncbi:hypothetical protein DH2020_009349 [Rehmannia glutinosa]|uniref:BHLH domain-containing protein n=1 Tax=Rehmannia glutinosa TaxID=99300 RepID=A0ABR0X8M4_REHGL